MTANGTTVQIEMSDLVETLAENIAVRVADKLKKDEIEPLKSRVEALERSRSGLDAVLGVAWKVLLSAASLAGLWRWAR